MHAPGRWYGDALRGQHGCESWGPLPPGIIWEECKSHPFFQCVEEDFLEETSRELSEWKRQARAGQTQSSETQEGLRAELLPQKRPARQRAASP